MSGPILNPADARRVLLLEAENAALSRAIRAHEENERLKQRAASLGIEAPVIPVTMSLIASEVAAAHGLSLEELKSPTNRHGVAHPRQEAMWRMRQIKLADGRHRWSLPAIGAFFGKDHTTALHAIRAVERRTAGRGPARDWLKDPGALDR